MCDGSSEASDSTPDRSYRDPEYLHEQYVERRRSVTTIAEECGVATTPICHWLARHGITDGESFETAECATCGERFRYYPSVRDGEYCSNECSNEPRKRRVTVVCEGCGEEYER